MHRLHPALYLLLLLVVSGSLRADLPATRAGKDAYARARYDDALRHFHAAISEGEKRGEPEFFIGSILEARRQYSDATPYFERAIQKPLESKFRTAALWKLVFYYQRTGNAEATLRYADELGRTGANVTRIRENAAAMVSPEKKAARENIRLAEAAESNGNYSDAAAYYRNAVAADPGFRQLLWKAAAASEKAASWAEAETTYLELSDTRDAALRARALYKSGLMAKRQRRFVEARAVLIRVASDKEADRDTRDFAVLHAAQASYALADYTAVTDLPSIRSEFPEARQAAAATACLGRMRLSKKPCRVNGDDIISRFTIVHAALLSEKEEPALRMALDEVILAESLPEWLESDIYDIAFALNARRHIRTVSFLERFAPLYTEDTRYQALKASAYFRERSYRKAAESAANAGSSDTLTRIRLYSFLRLQDYSSLTGFIERNPDPMIRTELEKAEFAAYRKSPEYQEYLRKMQPVADPVPESTDQ